jgi:hypothetical protein
VSDQLYKTAGAAGERKSRHRGAGMNIVPELAVMEALSVGLQRLAEDPNAIAECVDRLDAMEHYEEDDWRRGMVQALIEMLTPGSDAYLSVFVGFDAAVAHMPAIHLENAGGGENTGEAEVGDIIGEYFTLRNAVDDPDIETLADTQHMAVRHQVTGVGQSTQVVIGCWDPSPERALLIQAAARWAIWTQRGFLSTRGVHEFSWSEGAITPNPEMMPRPVSYVPTLTLTLRWTFRATESQIVPNRLRVTTKFSN